MLIREKDIQEKIASVVATLEMEGMCCTEEEKKWMAQILRKEITVEDAMCQIDKEFGIKSKK